MKKKLLTVVSLAALVVIIVMGILNKKELVLKDSEVDSPAVTVSVTSSNPSVQKLKLKELNIDWTRTVLIQDAITDDNIEPVVEYLVQLEKVDEPIYVIINSPGGSILAGEKFISAMESSKGPVYTICTGLCASMASVIHSHGTKRYMQNRAVLMFHDAAGSLEGSFQRMHSEFNIMQRKVDKLDEYICYRAKIDCKEFRKVKTDELWYDAEDSVALGFADGVVKSIGNPLTKPLPININLNNSSKKLNKTWSIENAE